MLQKGDKRTIRAWTFYDWANSVYPLVISSAIFPIFYEHVTTHDASGKVTSDMIRWAGIDFHNTAFLSFVVSLSYIIVALSSPVLSGIADYSGNKKRFMQFFCLLGAVSCMLLSQFSVEHIGWSMLALLFASVGYWGSIVFYNAYLPEIAEPKDHDRVSARGFAMGYFGSSLLLILILVMMKSQLLPAIGLPQLSAKYSFLLVGVWWLGFAQITFRRLPNNVFGRKVEGNPVTKGYRELRNVFRDVLTRIQLRRFLGSYFMYNMGVQTVMIMAVPFATKAITWENDEQKTTSLIISILLIQFLGIAGAFLMSWIAKFIGNLRTLAVVILFWVAICLFVYFVVKTPVHFYIVAACVGLVMGGIQSLSRSTYSKMLPETEDHASYFSFFDVSEKIGLAIGTSTFGLIEEATGGIRNSVLSLIITFFVGFLLLLRVPKSENVR